MLRRRFLVVPLLCGALLSPAYGEKPLPANTKADSIVVFKSKRELQLVAGGKVLKTYKISLGSSAIGAKQRQGDHKTPEGKYTIAGRNAKSQFHRSLRISYPNASDRERAARLGVSPGGDIFIHGLPNRYGWIGRGHLARDWTDGCIAVTDEEIEEIWRVVPDGTPVEIHP
jgi:murein L,D-transpeptidase YafK